MRSADILARIAILPLSLLMLTSAYTLTRASAASYDVRFDSTWSSQTHPGAYPSGAHFSPLVGVTHSDDVTFWVPGGVASPGIEQMAESGRTSTLRSEFRAASGSNTLIAGAGIGAPDSTTTSFDVGFNHSLVTLVTMVAPSPDWFVGVHDLNLRNGDEFVSELTVDLFSYDAGTDSGSGFTSSNADITPHIPITLLGAPLAGTPSLGTFTFSRIDGPILGDMNGDRETNFADLAPMVQALTDPAGWHQQYPNLDLVSRCDFSGQGACNFGALAPFAALLSGDPPSGPFGSAFSAATTVPEPATLMHIGIGALLLTLRSGKRNHSGQ